MKKYELIPLFGILYLAFYILLGYILSKIFKKK